MIPEQHLQLLKILSRELFCTSAETEQLLDLSAILLEAEQQAVFSLTFHALENNLRSGLSEEEFRLLSEKNSQYIARGLQNFYLHGEIHDLLKENHVPYIMLKGLCSAAYYPEPLLRTMGDVDFLVSLEDRDRAEKLLLSSGFQKTPHADEHGFHWTYLRDQQEVELHWRVPGIPVSGGEIIEKFLADAIQTGKINQVCGIEICGADELRHGLVLLLHTASHLTAGGVGLRHLLDWLVFENGMTERAFIDIFEKPLKETGLWTFAAALTRIGTLFLGCRDRDWCREIELELAEELLEDFFDGGNFGTKNLTRQGQTKIIRNNVSRSIEEGSVLRLSLVNIDQRARHDYPVCTDHAVLRPVFWIIIAAKYLVRVIQGKRVNIFRKDIYSGAKKRMRLYGKLQLFKPEQT